jgi:hypothetical protein
MRDNMMTLGALPEPMACSSCFSDIKNCSTATGAAKFLTRQREPLYCGREASMIVGH